MVDLTIRALARNDETQWLRLWRDYNAFYRRTASDAVTATTWERFFDEREPVHALVAASSGGMVGLVHYLFHRNTWLIGPVCYLQDLFVDPAARGAGVGRALIEAVYAQARGSGAERVYWLTHETNSQAMALYDKVAARSGFIQYRKDLPAPPSGREPGGSPGDSG